ncbi:nuclear transport factor 2 family protein [Mycobacterium sp. GA-2829]|uniref:nuclear transport factor 2 family protein n=1 Tax=Mycobacterium sp. GA-2829 TaxID=1772283 RepID=UPI00073FF852|nr:nuclear transport factor 2 family protein [Mycobacterium sp. GA-2829]KUI35041.1 limonene-1,2-epoxide hydrolase [Mycobacterium sp. GA-2829]
MSVENTVLGMWKSLSARDWDAVKTFLAPDCIYADMPLGPALAARGPDDIVKRLKVGLEPLAGYENHDGLLVDNGVDVMYEHSETWEWAGGETALLRFVTVHRIEDGKIALWKDYWDMAGLTATAPPTWLEDLASADTSWVFDATGMI